jgi:cell wall-associated NlpC family hydrolase
MVNGQGSADIMAKLMARLFVVLVALTAAACASTGHSPQPFPRPGGPAPAGMAPAPALTTPPPAAAAADGYTITGTALALRGSPYRNGGSAPSGFDCSGFVAYVFGQHGVSMPRTVTEQYRVGKDVNLRALDAGDLVFFSTTTSGASHVGIAIGGDEFIHAPSSTGEVRVERLSASYWSSRFVGARRVL